MSQVLLITGPAASGKTSLANRVGGLHGWICISEDDYWTRHGWGGGHRTEEQEATVQQEVLRDLQAYTNDGKNVVLEFILYKRPPNPLTRYMDRLQSTDINFTVVALKPSLETIIKRMQTRGRPDDLADLENRKQYASSQLGCLDDKSVDPLWILDTTSLDADEVATEVMEQLS